MNRYFISFFATSLLYLLLITTIFFYFTSASTPKDLPQESLCKFKIIAQKTQKIKPKIEPKIIKKKPKQKPKTLKPKPKSLKPKLPKPKPKITQKEPIKKYSMKPKSETRPVVTEKPKRTIEKKILTPIEEKGTIKKIIPLVAVKKKSIDNKQDKQRALFLAKLRETINQNKFYPNRAVKMGKEGNVQIEFTLNSKGQVNNIKILSGDKIFNESAIKSIKDSFPIDIDNTLFQFPKKFTITLVYHLE